MVFQSSFYSNQDDLCRKYRNVPSFRSEMMHTLQIISIFLLHGGKMIFISCFLVYSWWYWCNLGYKSEPKANYSLFFRKWWWNEAEHASVQILMLYHLIFILGSHFRPWTGLFFPSQRSDFRIVHLPSLYWDKGGFHLHGPPAVYQPTTQRNSTGISELIFKDAVLPLSPRSLYHDCVSLDNSNVSFSSLREIFDIHTLIL